MPVLTITPFFVFFVQSAGINPESECLGSHSERPQEVLILFGSWFVTGLTYYGLSLNSSDLGKTGDDDGEASAATDAYLTFTLYGLIEAPAIAFSIVSTITAGRRLTLTLLLVGVGISCVGAGVIPQGMFPGEEAIP